jgi:hypothetical protein
MKRHPSPRRLQEKARLAAQSGGCVALSGQVGIRTALLNWKFEAKGDFFAALAHTSTPDPDEMQVGIGYCIELIPYRAYLRDHVLMKTDEMNQFNMEAEAELSTSPFAKYRMPMA